ncbi:hypothetical protein EVAR_20982_1 [Eumeta japonica]|uniref:Uncharacterized protein n=1 Tax=Eumeta variegata TaxID=151549 RepID=A0A4C1V507_EUMVA|nr:hypothetical protein EVAR_20982_1 [Eumeta japonica]
MRHEGTDVYMSLDKSDPSYALEYAASEPACVLGAILNRSKLTNGFLIQVKLIVLHSPCLGEHVKPSVPDVVTLPMTSVLGGPRPALGRLGGLKLQVSQAGIKRLRENIPRLPGD